MHLGNNLRRLIRPIVDTALSVFWKQSSGLVALCLPAFCPVAQLSGAIHFLTAVWRANKRCAPNLFPFFIGIRFCSHTCRMASFHCPLSSEWKHLLFISDCPFVMDNVDVDVDADADAGWGTSKTANSKQ